jgi:AMP-binding enzyme
MNSSAEHPPDEDVPQTLGDLYLLSERSPVRRAVLRWRGDDQWEEMPGWRFNRQVIRIGLFLRERLNTKPGDRVLIRSSLRVERIVAEWATIAIGAIAVTLDGDLPDDAVPAVCGEFAPKVAFVDGPLDRLLDIRGAPAAESVVVLGPDSAGGGARPWSTVLDLGGSLDTAERAQSFRAQARSLAPSMGALAYRERTNGASTTLLTHAEIIGRLRAFWRRVPPREGDLAYVAAGRSSATVCLPLWAFVGDGRTSTALGTGGREADEIAGLAPHLIVGPPDLCDRTRLKEWPRRAERSVASRLLERVPLVEKLRSRLAPRAERAAPRRSVREILTFDGTRVGNEIGRL